MHPQVREGRSGIKLHFGSEWVFGVFNQLPAIFEVIASITAS